MFYSLLLQISAKKNSIQNFIKVCKWMVMNYIFSSRNLNIKSILSEVTKNTHSNKYSSFFRPQVTAIKSDKFILCHAKAKHREGKNITGVGAIE